MTLRDALTKVHNERCRELNITHNFSYSAYQYKFHKLLLVYNLDKNEYKIDSFSDANYDFTNIDVEFIKFIFDISDIDPACRKNSKKENFTISEYRNIIEYIKLSIKNKKYPLIQNNLANSAATEEFLSLSLLTNLTDKITKILAFACENRHADKKIYIELDKYLDTILYAYSIHQIGYQTINSAYSGKKLHADSNCSSTSFYRNDTSIDSTSSFKGLSAYMNRLHDDIRNCKSHNIDASFPLPNNKNSLFITYDFDNINSLESFLQSYVKYNYGLLSAIQSLLGIRIDELIIYINSLCYQMIVTVYDTKFHQQTKFAETSQIYKNWLYSSFTYIIDILSNKELDKLIKIAEICDIYYHNLNQEIINHLSDNSIWVHAQYSNFCCFLINESKRIYQKFIDSPEEFFIKILHKPFDMNPERANDNEFIDQLFKSSYLLLNLLTCFTLYFFDRYIQDNNDISKLCFSCSLQINYKGFCFPLQMIYDPLSELIENPESARNRINALVKAISDTEEQISSFYHASSKDLTDFRNNLYKSINESTGIFFREYEMYKENN